MSAPTPPPQPPTRTTRSASKRLREEFINPDETDVFYENVFARFNIMQELLNEANANIRKLLIENENIKCDLSVLKETVNKNECKSVRVSSYADKLKSGPVVLITPNDASQNSEKTKEVLKEKVNPTENKINGIRRAAKGAIIIECMDKNTSENIKASVTQNLGSEYKVELPKKRKR